MIEFLFKNGIVQILVVLVASPVWWPVVRSVWRELDRAGEEPPRLPQERGSAGPAPTPTPLELGSAHRTEVGLWSLADDPTWSKRRMVNPVWDRGRRTRRRGDEPGERGSITERVVTRTAVLRGHGVGRRPL